MQFISRLLLCSFDVASFSKKLKMASLRKRFAAANYDSREDMPDLVVAGPSGGPALYLHPPVLQAERSSSQQCSPLTTSRVPYYSLPLSLPVGTGGR